MANTQNIRDTVQISSIATLTAPVNQDKKFLVELKNGKAILRQKLLPLEKMSETMQEIVKFRDFMGKKVKEDPSTLTSFPEEHLPLLAKLTHESDKTINTLSKHIQETLNPISVDASEVDENEHPTASTSRPPLLPIAVIDSAVNSIAIRTNYGIEGPGKIPASLCIWKWEVVESHREWLPCSARDKLEARILERQQAKNDLRTLIDSLPQHERENLLRGGKQAKSDTTGGTLMFPVKGSTTTDENVPIALTQDGNADSSTSVVSGEGDAKGVSGRTKKEKSIDPERAAKEKEKADKKAARLEKERRAKDAQNKSRSVLSAFLKPKATPKASSSSLKPSINAVASVTKVEAGSSLSDFEKTFKPFVVKKDAHVAPINRFTSRRKGKEVIVLDEDIVMHSPQASLSGNLLGEKNFAMNSKEIFKNYLQATSSGRKTKQSSNLKSSSRYNVRDILSQLSEAEVLGDDETVRRLLMLLQSRDAIAAKVLVFHEDTRPGYFGTFTKLSMVVGPRTPFAKDAVAFDYSYDSGEEWEEEEGGDDLVSLDGSAEDACSEAGSEMDDWLVDDDNDVDPVTPLSEREGSPGLLIPPLSEPLAPKRKPIDAEDEKTAKKRKVVPLVAYTKGPYWEDEIGCCNYEPFETYRIQLFNDTPFPIDPFSFVSAPLVKRQQSPLKDGFAVPSLPNHIQTATQQQNANTVASSTTVSSSDSPSNLTVSSVPKRKAMGTLAPKFPFPDALLPFLAEKVEKLATGNLTWLIENLYQDLKSHKVKKNAIEAKVREVVEKCSSTRIWIVKEDVLKTIQT